MRLCWSNIPHGWKSHGVFPLVCVLLFVPLGGIDWFILGPVHMHTFTYISKVTYVSKFTYGACERTYSRKYKYSWSKLG